MDDLELINLCIMFFEQNDIFDLQVQNGYRQHTNKRVFYAFELSYNKQHFFNRNQKN